MQLDTHPQPPTVRLVRGRSIRLAAAGLAMAGVVTLVPLAAAAAEPAAPVAAAPVAAAPTDDLGPRLERACLRIPNLEIRTANLIQRLEGDAETRGSLAWLQAQIDKSTAQGRDQLVEVLRNRLAVRTQTLEVLRLRQDALPQLRELCVSHGVDL